MITLHYITSYNYITLKVIFT